VKLYRPNVPDSVKIAVAYKYFGNRPLIFMERPPLKERVRIAKESIARMLCCDPKDLRLDHDPPLAARPFNAKTRLYTPDANDPEHLFWITAADHRTKTIIRGANGQYSDIVLIKRERRLQRRKTKPKKKFQWAKGRKMQSRPFQTKGTP
jgi:hypothetical protein